LRTESVVDHCDALRIPVSQLNADQTPEPAEYSADREDRKRNVRR
jgi:hypothetical protein